MIPLALLGGIVLAGPDSMAVFGSSVERVQPEDDSVQVSVLFGSVSVIVPNDARVDTSGLVIFGSTSCTDACDATGDGPVIDVRGVGGFGSVVVYTEAEHAELNEADELDEADEFDD